VHVVSLGLNSELLRSCSKHQTPNTLRKSHSLIPTSVKVKHGILGRGIITILSPRSAVERPLPPNPVSALNIPGQVKQTKETMISWNLGDAYHGMVMPKILRSRYIHPSGRSGTTYSSPAGIGVSKDSLVSTFVSLMSAIVKVDCRPVVE
jgi:hypothetical protein